MLRHFLVAAVMVGMAGLPAIAQDQGLAAKGQELTAKNKCTVCHVVAGKGGKVGKPLDGVATRLDAAAIRRILTDPQKEFPDAKVKMPKVAWAPGDIDALVAYLQTLK